MKYRFYITNLYTGTIEGTEHEDIATSISKSEEFFVVDAQTGEWLHSSGVREAVQEFKS